MSLGHEGGGTIGLHDPDSSHPLAAAVTTPSIQESVAPARGRRARTKFRPAMDWSWKFTS
jgi:hypothetical protein